MPDEIPQEEFNTSERNNAVELCPDCGEVAGIIGQYEIEGRVIVTTYECPNCHHFGKTVTLP